VKYGAPSAACDKFSSRPHRTQTRAKPDRDVAFEFLAQKLGRSARDLLPDDL
jgi:hypothetical protein